MALAGWSVGSKASRWMEAMQAMIMACEQMSHDDWDRPVPLEPRWWYPSTGAPETMVGEPTTTTEGLMVQTVPDQDPQTSHMSLKKKPTKLQAC